MGHKEESTGLRMSWILKLERSFQLISLALSDSTPLHIQRNQKHTSSQWQAGHFVRLRAVCFLPFFFFNEYFSIFSTPSFLFFYFPDGSSGKEPTCQSRTFRRCRFNPWVGKIPWMRKWQPTPIILSGISHGQWSLVGYSPYSWKESDTTEHAPIFILNLATRHGMLDLCSLPRDQTSNPCIVRAEC